MIKSLCKKVSQQGHLNILFSAHYPPSIAISNGNISINQRLSDYSLMINSQNVCIPAHLFNITWNIKSKYTTEKTQVKMYSGFFNQNEPE